MRISDWSSDVCSSDLPAGSKWVYKTGETNLIGVLVSSATGKTLSQYLSEKIWKPFGMEQDAVWMLGATGHEISGCCMSASLKDYARFGQFILNGGVEGGQKVLPDDWIASATTKQAGIDVQIAREWGMERGCQYVYISGVAVERKKKN